jgi:hypothetical protein
LRKFKLRGSVWTNTRRYKWGTTLLCFGTVIFLCHR